MKDVINIAIAALQANQQAWKTLADSGDAGNWKAEDQPLWKQTEAALTIMRGLADAEPVACLVSSISSNICALGTRGCLNHPHTSPQAAQPSESDLQVILKGYMDDLYERAELLGVHKQEMYDEAFFTGHMNMLDYSLPQCVNSAELAKGHYQVLVNYLDNWKPKKQPAKTETLSPEKINLLDETMALIRKVTQPTEAQEREAFEAIYRDLYPTACMLRDKFEREFDEYTDTIVLVAFNLWKAGRAGRKG